MSSRPYHSPNSDRGSLLAKMLSFLKDFTKIFVRLLSFQIVSSPVFHIIYCVGNVFLNELPYESKPPKTLRSHFRKISFPIFLFLRKTAYFTYQRQHLYCSRTKNLQTHIKPDLCDISSIFCQNIEEIFHSHINPTSWRFHSLASSSVMRFNNYKNINFLIFPPRQTS